MATSSGKRGFSEISQSPAPSFFKQETVDSNGVDLPPCPDCKTQDFVTTVQSHSERNPDRWFFSCANESHGKGKFIKWVDGGKTNFTDNNKTNGVVGGGGSCYNCGAHGHWSNKCPQPRKQKAIESQEQVTFRRQVEAALVRTYDRVNEVTQQVTEMGKQLDQILALLEKRKR